MMQKRSSPIRKHFIPVLRCTVLLIFLCSPAGGNVYASGEKENKAVAKRWNEEILNERRFEALGEVLARNYVHYDAADSSWSPGVQGLAQAKEQAKESLEAGWFAQHPTWRVSIDDIIGEGDRVAARLLLPKPRGSSRRR